MTKFRAEIKTLTSQTLTNPCLPEITENTEIPCFSRFLTRKNHLCFWKCSKLLTKQSKLSKLSEIKSLASQTYRVLMN